MNSIAVLLSTYCGSAHLVDFFESLCSQNESNFTIFVRDDGSTDDTISVVQSYSTRLSIIFTKGSSRLGPAKSFMKLLEVVPDSYSYFFFADQDDYWHPQKIEQAVKVLSLYEDKAALYCARLEIVDAQLNHLSYTKIPKIIGFSNALVENIATGCTIAINLRARGLLLKHLPNKIIMHDWWMYVVISALGVILYDDSVYIKYRQHGGNVIGMGANFFSDYFSRATRFLKSDSVSSSAISVQASEFFQCFAFCVSQEQLNLISYLIEGKKSFLKRCHLIFFTRLPRQNIFSSCVLKFRFLINRY